MAIKNKKQKLNTAYQNHLDLLKALGIVMFVIPIGAIITIYYMLQADMYTEMIYKIFVFALFGLIAGIVISVIASMKQNIADSINENLYAIWKYKPETIYKFYRKMCRRQSKSSFWSLTSTAAIVLVISIIMLLNEVSYYLGIVFLVGAIIIFLCGVYTLPYIQYLLLKLRTHILGDAKEIIFSRSGIWYCGKVCFFGDNGITYHRVERKEIYGQDAIIFYYTKTRGFQQTPMELVIPVAPKMAYAADDLVNEFNRSDLLTTESD